MAINRGISKSLNVQAPNFYKGLTPFQQQLVAHQQQRFDKTQDDLNETVFEQEVYGAPDSERVSKYLKEYDDEVYNLSSTLKTADQTRDVSRKAAALQRKFNNDPRSQAFKARGEQYTLDMAQTMQQDPRMRGPAQAAVRRAYEEKWQTEEGFDTMPTQGMTFSSTPDIEKTYAALASQLKANGVPVTGDGTIISKPTEDGTDEFYLLKEGKETKIEKNRAINLLKDAAKRLPVFQNARRQLEAYGVEDSVLADYDADVLAGAEVFGGLAAFSDVDTDYTNLGSKAAAEAKRAKEEEELEDPGADISSIMVPGGEGVAPTDKHSTLSTDPVEFVDTYGKETTDAASVAQLLNESTAHTLNHAPGVQVGSIPGVPNSGIDVPLEQRKQPLVVQRANGLYDFDIGRIRNADLGFPEGTSLQEQNDVKEKMIHSLLRYNYSTGYSRPLLDKALSDNSTSFKDFQEHKDFFNASPERKEKVATELAGQTYEAYLEQKMATIPTVGREATDAMASIQTKEQWVNSVYKKETGADVGAIETSFNNAYKEQRKNDLEAVSYQFNRILSDKEAGDWRIKDLNPEGLAFYDFARAREENYISYGVNSIRGMETVMDKDGNLVDFDGEEGPFGLKNDSETKTTIMGYGRNPHTNEVIEAIQVEYTDADGALQNTMFYVSDNSLEEMNAQLQGIGSFEEKSANLRKQLSYNDGALIELGGNKNFGYTIMEQEGNKGTYDVQVTRSNGSQMQVLNSYEYGIDEIVALLDGIKIRDAQLKDGATWEEILEEVLGGGQVEGK